MVEILAVFKCGQGCRLAVFFDSLTKSPGGFSNVGGVTPIYQETAQKCPGISQKTQQGMDLQDYMIGAKYTTTDCSPQATLPLCLGFMVYLKYTKLTVPCTL